MFKCKCDVLNSEIRTTNRTFNLLNYKFSFLLGSLSCFLDHTEIEHFISFEKQKNERLFLNNLLINPHITN